MSNPNKGVHLSMYAGFEAQGLTAGVGVGCVNTRDLRAIRFVESIAAIRRNQPNFNLSNTSSYGRDGESRGVVIDGRREPRQFWEILGY